MEFELTVWANGFNVWHCRVDFSFGVGNTPDAEALKYRALRRAKREIRKQLKTREGSKLGRLSYEVADNEFDSLNRLWSITVREKTPN